MEKGSTKDYVYRRSVTSIFTTPNVNQTGIRTKKPFVNKTPPPLHKKAHFQTVETKLRQIISIASKSESNSSKTRTTRNYITPTYYIRWKKKTCGYANTPQCNLNL